MLVLEEEVSKHLVNCTVLPWNYRRARTKKLIRLLQQRKERRVNEFDSTINTTNSYMKIHLNFI